MQYEVKNNKTGKTIWVDENQLSQYGLSAPAQKKPQGILEKAGKTASDVGNFLFPNTIEQGKKVLAGESELQKRKQQDIQDIRTPGNQLKDWGKYLWHGAQESLPPLGLATSKDYRREIASPGLEIAGWMMPATKVTKGAGLGKFAVQKGIQGATSAAPFALSNYLRDEDKKELQDVFYEVATGTGVNIGTGLAGRVISGLFKYATKTIPKATFSKVFNLDPEKAQRLLESDSPTKITKMKKWGEKTLKTTGKEIDKLDLPNLKTEEILGKDPVTQLDRLNTIIKYTNKLEDRTNDKKFLTNAMEELIDTGELDFRKANKLKSLLSDNTYKLDSTPKGNNTAQNLANIADEIRGNLRKDKKMAQLLDLQQIAIVMRDTSGKIETKKLRTMLMPIFELGIIGGSVGAILGGGIGGAAIGGTLGALGAYKAQQSPAVARGLYKTGQAASKVGSSGSYKKLEEFLRKGIIRESIKGE